MYWLADEIYDLMFVDAEDSPVVNTSKSQNDWRYMTILKQLALNRSFEHPLWDYFNQHPNYFRNSAVRPVSGAHNYINTLLKVFKPEMSDMSVIANDSTGIHLYHNMHNNVRYILRLFDIGHTEEKQRGLAVDFMLSELDTVIEVDGPNHFVHPRK